MSTTLMTTREVATILGVSLTTVRNRVQAGELRAARTPTGYLRIDSRSVRDLALAETERLVLERLVA